jgi:hypothetical protein
VLKKLLKYEFKSVFYLLLPLYFAVLMVSAVCRLFINIDFLQEVFNGLPFFFICAVYFGLFVGMFAVTLLMIVQRFYKGLLSEEGYLMFTLPVKPWQLIISKGIVSTVIVLISGIIMIMSIFILTLNLGDIWSIFFNHEVIRFDRLFEKFRTWPLFVLEFILLMFIYLWKHIAHTYSAMAIGQLSNKHRAVLSIIAYSVEWFAISLFWISVIEFSNKFHFRLPSSWDYWMNEHGEFSLHFGMWILLIWQGLELAFYYISTHYILSKKLNLE